MQVSQRGTGQIKLSSIWTCDQYKSSTVGRGRHFKHRATGICPTRCFVHFNSLFRFVVSNVRTKKNSTHLHRRSWWKIVLFCYSFTRGLLHMRLHSQDLQQRFSNISQCFPSFFLLWQILLSSELSGKRTILIMLTGAQLFPLFVLFSRSSSSLSRWSLYSLGSIDIQTFLSTEVTYLAHNNREK